MDYLWRQKNYVSRVKRLLHVQTGHLLQHKQNVHQNQYQVLLHVQTGHLLQHKQNVHQYQQRAQEQLQTCQDGSVVSVNEACSEPETLTCPDGSTVSVDEDCPPTDKPLPDCDGSFQDCVTQGGFVCPAGSAAHECELPEPVSRELPDKDCLFDTELSKCASDANGKCPDGFETNEDGRCFVIHGECPDGYHGHEDDETGECISDNKPCEKGYEKADDGKNCERSSNYWCERNPVLKECYDNGNKKNDNNKNGGSGSKSSSSSKTTIINSNADPNAVELSTCKLNGNTDGLQQKFDSIKYRACGLYPSAQLAYTNGFVVGCTQVGNTQQLCQAFVVMNTQQTQTTVTQPQTQPNTQSSTQPTQTQPLTQSTQAIQPAAVS